MSARRRKIRRLAVDPATSVSGYLERVKKIATAWDKDWDEAALWFRGQLSSWELVPGAYRSGGRDAIEREEEDRDQFQLRAAPFLRDATHDVPLVPAGAWEWYFLMQHYGLRTRLLDWTESALVALYFAIEPSGIAPKKRKGPKGQRRSTSPDRTERCVWVLDPHAMNDRFHKDDTIRIHSEDPAPRYLSPVPLLSDKKRDAFYSDMPAEPLAIQPPLLTRRIAAQRGHFTIHGSDRKGLQTYDQLTDDRRLVRIRIPRDSVHKVRDELEIAGITRSIVYPELLSVAKELGGG